MAENREGSKSKRQCDAGEWGGEDGGITSSKRILENGGITSPKRILENGSAETDAFEFAEQGGIRRRKRKQSNCKNFDGFFCGVHK